MVAKVTTSHHRRDSAPEAFEVSFMEMGKFAIPVELLTDGPHVRLKLSH